MEDVIYDVVEDEAVELVEECHDEESEILEDQRLSKLSHLSSLLSSINVGTNLRRHLEGVEPELQGVGDDDVMHSLDFSDSIPTAREVKRATAPPGNPRFSAQLD